MVRPIAKIAAILAAVAVPVELLNDRFFAFPIDVGYENPTWFQQVTGTEWVLLHYPGLRLLAPMENHGFQRLEWSTVLISGYLDTFLIAFLGILLFRWLARRRKRVAAST
jgi:hypothetical protein